MVTGDNVFTAVSIAELCGITQKSNDEETANLAIDILDWEYG